MLLEARAIVAPEDRMMLVALLVTLAQGEARDVPGEGSKAVTRGSLLGRLARLSLTEVRRLAETGAIQLVLHYDGDQVAWSLQAAARRHAEQALVEYLVRHGAPRALMRELLAVSRERIGAVRRDLGLAPIQGRPRLPPVAEREAIVTAWGELERAEADLPARYQALHRRFPRYSIAALDAVLREVSPENASLAARSEKPPTSAPVSAPRDPRRRAPAASKRAVVHRRVPR